MTRRTFCALLVAFAMAPHGAGAEQRGTPPKFSFSEQIIIERNDTLVQLVAIDPWGVRTVLDSIDSARKLRPEQKLTARTKKNRDLSNDRERAEDKRLLDPAKNPDLHILFQRTSPEAAYDLFQIIKRVGRQSAK